MPKLKFSRKIYKKKALQEGISAYAHLANLRFSFDKNYFKVKIDNIEPSFRNIIADEFTNYVLIATKKCL